MRTGTGTGLMPRVAWLVWLAFAPAAWAGPLMPLRHLVQVGAGSDHSCARTTSGGVKCWGSNAAGKLGDGTTTDRLLPVDVTGLSGATAISVGYGHTCALTAAGGVKCWGANSYGQLGDGSTTHRSTPVDVVDLGSGVAAVSVGTYHTCAVTTAGAVKCWGRNLSGQIGDGGYVNRPVPTTVTGLGSGMKAVDAGHLHTCALTLAGGVKCWGRNYYGQIGIGGSSQLDVLTPANVVGLGSGVTLVSAGGDHTCARTDAGAAKCWGADYYGQTGVGGDDRSDRFQPVDVTGAGSGVASIAAGHVHSCLRTSAGAVKCWGWNILGQLGDGRNTDRILPVTVPGLSGVTGLSTGNNHTCVLTAAGGAKCWGDNGYGQLGDDRTRESVHPVPKNVSGLSGGVASLRTGSSHTCAVTTTGALRCWGHNLYGQLGVGSRDWRIAPAEVSGMGSGTLAVDAGGQHTCAVRTGGGVRCWGGNYYGSVGDGDFFDRLTPVNVSGLTSGVAALALGTRHSCALTASGGLKCWGASDAGQTGTGVFTTRVLTPQDVTGLASGVTLAGAGSLHGCAIAGGAAKCWGWNLHGQIGDGSNENRAVPANVSGLGQGMRAISPGTAHTCALTQSGGVKCWGFNESGALGDGTTTTRNVPGDVAGLTTGVAAIAMGDHSCALTTNGGVTCWGRNDFGQLGDGSTTNRLTPVSVTGLSSGVAAIAVGFLHSCALTTSGGVKCWGRDLEGTLGLGGRDDRLPGDVLTPDPGFLFGSGFEDGEQPASNPG